MSYIIEVLLYRTPQPSTTGSYDASTDTAEAPDERCIGQIRFRKLPVAEHVSRRLAELSGWAVDRCWSLHPEDVLLLRDAALGYNENDVVSRFDSAFRELIRGADAWAVNFETDKGPATAVKREIPDHVTGLLLTAFHPGLEQGYGGLVILPADGLSPSSARK